MEEKIKVIIKEALELIGIEDSKNIKIEIETPPNVEMGDFTFGCFVLAGILRKAPEGIAKILEETILNKLAENSKDNTKTIWQFLEKVDAVGPYLNFKINRSQLFGDAYKQIISNTGNSISTEGGLKKVMVEYLSPNTNKPLHLGHLRNGALGMATSNILEAAGNDVVKANLINDRGVHICKSMLAWKLFANGETPESSGMKGDHFVGKYYVKFAQEVEKNPELDVQVQEMLQDWENGDEEVLKLWEMMNEWVFKGFQSSFNTIGFEFDIIYKESETYKLGKDIIKKGIEKGIFKKEENGAVIFELSDKFGFEEDGDNKKITVLRKDGTSVYVTQDIGTAVHKADGYKLDESIYVVGSEQEYYFRSLFEILKALGYSWAKNSFHLSYGMVYLPDGKMKSREGKVIDADDLVAKVAELAKMGITERQRDGSIEDEETERRALIIALGAIKFYLLKVGPTQDIHFDPKEALSFEGFTGPYCQYAYARASKLLRDAGIKKDEEMNADFSVLGSDSELQIIKKVLESDSKIKRAGDKLNPSLIAVHVFELAKAFNQFYHGETILKSEKKIKLARLALVQIFLKTVKKELNLLGIDVLEEM